MSVTLKEIVVIIRIDVAVKTPCRKIRLPVISQSNINVRSHVLAFIEIKHRQGRKFGIGAAINPVEASKSKGPRKSKGA